MHVQDLVNDNNGDLYSAPTSLSTKHCRLSTFSYIVSQGISDAKKQ